jgi:hypothetical protein
MPELPGGCSREVTGGNVKMAALLRHTLDERSSGRVRERLAR